MAAKGLVRQSPFLPLLRLTPYRFLNLWEWEVCVLEVEPGVPEDWRPHCLAGRAATPPEDCGGWSFRAVPQKHQPVILEFESQTDTEAGHSGSGAQH